MSKINKIIVIGCKVLEPDLRIAAEKLKINADFKILDSQLHEDCAQLRNELQQTIDEVSQDESYGRIILGYGICGKGTAGLKAGNLPLVIAQAQDCISFFLGSAEEYQRQFTQNPGTYYISTGLCAEGSDVAKSIQNYQIFKSVGDYDELIKKYGKDNAEYLSDFFGQWYKNYNRLVLIDNGTADMQKAQDCAEKLAEKYGWKLCRKAMDYHLLEKLLTATQSDDEIIIIPPKAETVFDEINAKLVVKPCATS